jgi:hypothetical protein
MLADLFTKPLVKTIFNSLRSLIGVTTLSESRGSVGDSDPDQSIHSLASQHSYPQIDG